MKDPILAHRERQQKYRTSPGHKMVEIRMPITLYQEVKDQSEYQSTSMQSLMLKWIREGIENGSPT